MNITKQTIGTDRKALLSTLWLFVLLNMIFRDIHEMPFLILELIADPVKLTQISNELMLVAGIVLEIPIVMVLLSRLLPYRINRWANIVAGVLTAVMIIANTTAPDLDDIFFAAVEIVGLALILWYAWNLPKQEA